MDLSFTKLTDEIFVAGAQTPRHLERARAAGIRRVIDLRTDGEPTPHALSPQAERACAEEIGLAYEQMPVTASALDLPTALAITRAIAGGDDPVLIHCASGRRAVTIGLMLLAERRGLTTGQCRAEARALGHDFEEMPALAHFLDAWVERCERRRAAGGEGT